MANLILVILFFVASVGKGQKGLETEGQRDRGTKRQSEVGYQILSARSLCLIVPLSHCPKKNRETTHTFYDLWYSRMIKRMTSYHDKENFLSEGRQIWL